jgi:ubiquinone/menaquinone biosynthesis C-methylase UbiE
MNIRDEIQVYDNAEVSSSTGETESYDSAFFPKVIRKRELEIIKQVIQAKRPRLILDYGCGGGWLSKILSEWGFDVVGVDISRNMVRSAKLVCHESDFVVCDAVKLPFRNEIFDFTIGISILHHLHLERALTELSRVSHARSAFLFMEPSSLNPLSAFGRRFFPMEAHTKAERQFTPAYLKAALNLANFDVEKLFSLFFISFPIARFSKLTKMNASSSFVKITYLFENFTEKMPGVRYLNSNIVAMVKAKS